MTTIRIDEITESKSGKSWRIKCGSNWYGASKDDFTLADKGHTFEAEVQTGDFGPWLNKLADKKVTSSSQNKGALPPAPPTIAVSAPYWQTFVSNQVASAIQAGLIKDPEQLKAWTFAAMNAIKGAVEGDIGI